jgi:hypothetical protein
MLIQLIPEPFQFNPLKHHLAFIRDFSQRAERSGETVEIVKTVRHIGSSVMDVYTGQLSVSDVLNEAVTYLADHDLLSHERFMKWTGTGFSDFRNLHLSDESEWILKYNNSIQKYVHIFPARFGPHTFRVKANTLKSAILYIILSGKDYVSEDEINNVRAFAGLSPVKEITESEAIFRIIEMLRS